MGEPTLEKVRAGLLHPQHLVSPVECFSKPCPVPKEPGWYAWYFRDFPKKIPVSNCWKLDEWILLYLGIAPKGVDSREDLRRRIKFYLRGNAYGSTLRLSLGCLLAQELGLELRRVGEKRATFTKMGEAILSQWLCDNARVTWVKGVKPWQFEAALIQGLSLPLNLDCNKHHFFYPILANFRSEAKKKAKELPVVKD